MNKLNEKFLKDFLNQLETTKLVEVMKGLIADSTNVPVEYKAEPDLKATISEKFTDVNDLVKLKSHLNNEIKDFTTIYADFKFEAFEYLLKAARANNNLLATLTVQDLNKKFKTLVKGLSQDFTFQNYYDFWNTLSNSDKNALLFDFTMLKYSSKLMPDDETQSPFAALRKEGALSLPKSSVLEEVFNNPEVQKFAQESFIKQELGLESPNLAKIDSFIKEEPIPEERSELWENRYQD